MANLTLHTVQFPGLSDTYVIPEEAADFSTTSTYNVGDYVIYQGSLYRCKVAVETAGIWTSDSNWELTSISAELKNHKDNTSNPHSVTKTQVGLSAVANERQYSSSNKPPASNVTYSNSSSGLSETDVQAAIDELNSSKVPVVGFGYNFVRNWYFVGGGTREGVFPVNPLGKTTYNASEIAISGWRTAGSSIMTLVSDGITIEPTSDATQSYVVQDTGDAPLGYQITLSVLEGNGTLRVKGATLPSSAPSSGYANSISIGGPNDGYLYRVRVSSSGHMELLFFNYINTPLKIKACKIELGTIPTLCHNEGTSQNPVWVLNEIPKYEDEYFRCITNKSYSLDTTANFTPATEQEIANYVESGYTASRAYKVGEFFCLFGNLYQVTSAISNGGTIIPGTNCQISFATAWARFGLGTMTSTQPLPISDCDNVLQNGWFDCGSSTLHRPSGINTSYAGVLFSCVRGEQYRYQIYCASFDGRVYHRLRNQNGWSNWVQLQQFTWPQS